MSTRFTGRLLIAGPSLGDANFDRTIVYLLEHGPEGALGVVVNRPSEFPVGDALPLWAAAVGQPPVVFSGGPVEAGVALGLGPGARDARLPGLVRRRRHHRLGRPEHGSRGHRGRSRDRPRLRRLRRLGAGQLDEEVAGGAWLVVDAEPDDLFTTAPEHLWGEVLRRDSAKAAMAGANPSWN